MKESSQYDKSTEDEEEAGTTESLQVHNVLNNTMHDEDDSIQDEDDSPEHENITENETYQDNGEQNNVEDNKLLTTNFEVKVENQKVEWLITYSKDQKIKRYSNLRLILEITKSYGEFILTFNQFTVNGQLMLFHSVWVSMQQQKIQM